MPREYSYQSVLAPYIRDLITEKRQLGFSYDDQSYHLYRLDQYWIECGYPDFHLTKERLNKWTCAFSGEGKSSHSKRISAAKSLAVYLNTHGINCDIPLNYVGKAHPYIHVMDHTERKQFFEAVDSYTPYSINRQDYRMADEYPVVFRLFYCCGLRNNEVCSLRPSDVDFEKGIITIYNGKGHKDRLVYLSEDMKLLLKCYYTWLKNCLGHEPYWLFPGRIPEKHVPKTSIDRKFREFWNKTPASKYCDKAPTPHSLRHGFVVDRINSWILMDIDINVMFLYLSKYLGHKDPDESYYYYHLAQDAFRIIRKKDTVSEEVLPEVRRR